MSEMERDYPDEALVFEPVRGESRQEAQTGTEIKRLGTGMRIMSLYREWLGLPNRIRSQMPLAKHNLTRVQKSLMEYRLELLRFKFYAVKVDAEIWETYRSVLAGVAGLEKKTKTRRLRFNSLTYLRELLKEWETLIQRQEEFLVAIEKAPGSFEFYNKMMTFQQMHRTERRESEETSQKFSKAYQGLEGAIQYIEKFNSDNEMSIFGSSVLRVDAARAYWDERLNAIRQMEADGNDPDEIITEIDHLKDVMFESPALAKWVHDTEQRFNRISRDHELLVESFGKAVIPDAEMRENQAILSEAVPNLWATGQRQQLEQSIHGLENFISTYDAQVDSELSFAERHSLRRGTGSEAVVASQEQSLRQMADLVRVLVTAIEGREPSMENHSATVAKYSVEVGRALNWPEEDVHYLELAALLHDVGKVWIPESVLAKEGALSAEDAEQMKRHTLYGAQILESVDALKDIAPWVYYHQERWDGSGYPEGLAGEEIPVAARIIAATEAYTAMLSGGPAKPPLSNEAGVMELQSQAGLAFDPNIVDVFVKVIRNSG